MLHFSKIIPIVERKDANGKPIPFSIKYLKADGNFMEAESVVCTSTSHKGTINIKWPNNEIRKVRLVNILKINNKKIFN